MSVDPSKLPGMTEYLAEFGKKQLPYCSIYKPKSEKKIILLSGSKIIKQNIFVNGLIQNVYILYKMFESMGWTPILIVDSLPESVNDVPDYLLSARMMTLETVYKSSIKPDVLMEVGMSIQTDVKQKYRNNGTKVVRVYLGNILNIDVETPIMFNSLFFPHHLLGALDDVYVSPHYAQHAQYARAVNKHGITDTNDNIVPYVWDSTILTDQGNRNFRWKSTTNSPTFLILEPNISFQKAALVPLCIVENWYRKNPTWDGKVVVVNGHSLLNYDYFKSSIGPTLNIIKDNKVEFKSRMSIVEVFNEFPSGIPICYQWNNEYNYMVLEYFHALYPVLHNVSDWKQCGYYFENSNIDDGERVLDYIINNHKDCLEIYSSHVSCLLWKHNPYNPDVHEAWGKIIASKAN